MQFDQAINGNVCYEEFVEFIEFVLFFLEQISPSVHVQLHTCRTQI